MKIHSHFFVWATLTLLCSCNNNSTLNAEKTAIYGEPIDTNVHIDTRGYWGSGEIITEWNCPDSRFFPAIDLKNWEKTPVVAGRFPTYSETINGSAIHTYENGRDKNVSLVNIKLPKLAYFLRYNGFDGNQSDTNSSEIVMIIQMVQYKTDTIVGFRYLSGGVGGTTLKHFRFLNEQEIENTTEQWKKLNIKDVKLGTLNNPC